MSNQFFIEQAYANAEEKIDVRLEGYALKQPLNIYSRADKNSKVLKTYNYNQKIIYYTYSNEWHRAIVYLNGIPYRGYIHKDDVGENPTKSVKGIALNDTKVYRNPDTNSDVLKTYKKGSILQYRSYIDGWLIAKVYVDGKSETGYISMRDVETAQSTPLDLQGIPAKKEIDVYQKPTTHSKVLKSYKQGHILKYRSFTKDWHEATVLINGKRETGYIYAKDVETLGEVEQDSFKGIGTKNPTKIYEKPSPDAKVLKSYKQGQILKYSTFTRSWYEATVYVNGERRTGYLSAKDVETIEETNIEKFKGVGIKDPTNVYSAASTSSKPLKSYKQGQILQFKSFTKNWYEATVYVNGKKKTGYIYAKDVELIVDDQSNLNGIALKQRTNVYTLASNKSKVLKSYHFGQILKFKTFTDNWYEATVYVNGNRQTGYISKDDVNTNLDDILTGYALKNKTKVYSAPSQSSKVLKEYSIGHILKFRSFNSNWFIATVYLNGEKKTGYIYTKDVSPNPLTFYVYASKKATNVYSGKTKNSKILKSYALGTKLKLTYHNSSWYEATVYVQGKPRKGYVYVGDVTDRPPKAINNSSTKKNENIISDLNEPTFKVPILMYHQIGDPPKPHQYGTFVSAESFKEQMTYLKNNGYTLINFEDLQNAENIEKPIIVTFDDGYENNMIAYQILKELKDDTFDPKATFFIIARNIGKTTEDKVFLNEEQIREISDSGIISIQSHTMTHVHFNDEEIESIDYDYQLLKSKQILEELTGKEVHTLAYPYGAVNDVVLAETQKYYRYAVLVRSGIATSNDSPHLLPRVRVSYDTTIDQFAKLIGE